MEENLLGVKENDKKTIGIPSVKESDCLAWNLCGGSFILGCWFGVCLLPLIQITKPVKKG